MLLAVIDFYKKSRFEINRNINIDLNNKAKHILFENPGG